MNLIVSGYGEKGNKNIIKCDERGNVIWYDTIEAPSFVEVCGNRMFAATEVEHEAYIHSYVADGDGYRLVDSARFDGGFLCHICYSEKNNMVFGACWGTGHLLYATIDEEGKFVKTGSVYQANESGDESLITRVHYVSVNKAEDT